MLLCRWHKTKMNHSLQIHSKSTLSLLWMPRMRFHNGEQSYLRYPRGWQHPDINLEWIELVQMILHFSSHNEESTSRCCLRPLQIQAMPPKQAELAQATLLDSLRKIRRICPHNLLPPQGIASILLQGQLKKPRYVNNGAKRWSCANLFRSQSWDLNVWQSRQALKAVLLGYLASIPIYSFHKEGPWSLLMYLSASVSFH